MTQHQPAPLPADRLAARREHLMSETQHPHRRGLTRRVKALVGGLLAAAVVGGGTVAVAGVPGVTRQDNGVVRIDQNGLDAWHQGRIVTPDQLDALRADGKAGYSAQSVELACHGVVAYFDTPAEEQAYGDGYADRAKEIAAKRRALAPDTDPADTDPCAWWKGTDTGLAGLR
jgi:hypothetical protein